MPITQQRDHDGRQIDAARADEPCAMVADLPEPLPGDHADLRALIAGLEYLQWDQRLAFGRAARVEAHARERGWTDLEMRAHLLHVEGRLEDGDLVWVASAAEAINAWAVQHGDNYVIARSHNLIAKVFRSIGDGAQFLAHTVQAVRHTHDDAPAWVRSVHIAWLAVALIHHRLIDEARSRFAEAVAIARSTDDPAVELRALNNFAYCMYDIGDDVAAAEVAAVMLDIQRTRSVRPFGEYVDTLARVEMMRGRYHAAEALLRPVIDNPGSLRMTEADALPVCLLTLAECQRNLDDTVAAQLTLDECRQMADERGLRQVATEVMAEQARLHAHVGAYREAYEELTRSITEAAALQDTEQEVRAQVVHALHVNEEAQRARDRFEVLAFQDPLTGLWNRRYVDDSLAELVAAATDDAPLSIALVDLDRFKQINDTMSHDAGDEVLVTVARLLTAHAPAGVTVARLGGDEFLLIMSAMPIWKAVEQCERLRAAISGHDWQGVTGDFAVNASMGVAATSAGATSSTLLAAADRHLYAAKRAGRGRVTAGAPQPG